MLIRDFWPKEIRGFGLEISFLSAQFFNELGPRNCGLLVSKSHSRWVFQCPLKAQRNWGAFGLWNVMHISSQMKFSNAHLWPREMEALGLQVQFSSFQRWYFQWNWVLRVLKRYVRQSRDEFNAQISKEHYDHKGPALRGKGSWQGPNLTVPFFVPAFSGGHLDFASSKTQKMPVETIALINTKLFHWIISQSGERFFELTRGLLNTRHNQNHVNNVKLVHHKSPNNALKTCLSGLQKCA